MAQPNAAMYPNLRDVAARYQDEKILAVAEVLSKAHPILEDIFVQEANGVDSNTSVIRTGLPEVAFRVLYGGVQPSKSTVMKIMDTPGSLEGYSKVDEGIVQMNANPREFRGDEDKAFLKQMGGIMAEHIFYGKKDSKSFYGLSGRYSTLDRAKAATAENVIDAGGSSNLSSIWIVTHGSQTTYAFYPRGSKIGFQSTDKGAETTAAVDGSGDYEALVTHYKWQLGLTVRDWRYNVRIANVDVNNLGSQTLSNLLIKALNLLPDHTTGNVKIYCNRDVLTALDIERTNKSNVILNLSEYTGDWVLNARGIAIRKCDALLSGEEQVA